jgi:large subunit ribosomal protein L29
MKSKDLRERSVEDLKELEKSLRKDLFQHRFKNFTNRLDDTSLVRKTKKDLARVITLLGQHTKGTVPVAAEKAPKAPKAKKAAAPKAEAKAAAPKKSAKKTEKAEAK